MKPYMVTALPQVKKSKPKAQRPLPGVSYLSTSGIYDEMMAARNPN